MRLAGRYLRPEGSQGVGHQRWSLDRRHVPGVWNHGEAPTRRVRHLIGFGHRRWEHRSLRRSPRPGPRDLASTEVRSGRSFIPWRAATIDSVGVASTIVRNRARVHNEADSSNRTPIRSLASADPAVRRHTCGGGVAALPPRLGVGGRLRVDHRQRAQTIPDSARRTRVRCIHPSRIRQDRPVRSQSASRIAMQVVGVTLHRKVALGGRGRTAEPAKVRGDTPPDVGESSKSDRATSWSRAGIRGRTTATDPLPCSRYENVWSLAVMWFMSGVLHIRAAPFGSRGRQGVPEPPVPRLG